MKFIMDRAFIRRLISLTIDVLDPRTITERYSVQCMYIGTYCQRDHLSRLPRVDQQSAVNTT